ncbi:MAG TPA: hypothetical protein VMT54_22975 [Candidatus Cybelea sp.]|nr:hypothetical protein [Candidatus Cybelea sp.]
MGRMTAGVLAIAVSASTAAAGPMTNDMDLIYGRYQMAIRAAILCRSLQPNDQTWRQWSTYLDRKTNHELGAGERLSVLDGAKDDVMLMVRRKGCDSDQVKDLLSLYDAELAGMAK